MASGRFLADGIAKREKEGRHRVPQKNRPPKLTRKRPHLGVGSLGSRRVVENFHALCAAGRRWPSQVAYALWRRAAHRDCFARESAPEAIAFPFSRRCRAGSLSQVRRVGCSCRVRHLNAAVTYFDE